MHTTTPGAALTAAVLGAGVGLVTAAVQTHRHGYPPLLTIAAPVAIALVVLALLLAIRYMRVRLRVTAVVPPDPHLAVRLFMLGRACTLVGSVVVGVYVALGAQRLAVEGLTGPRNQLLLAAAGLVAGLAMTITAVVLERSCRYPGDPPAADSRGLDGWSPSIAGDS